MDANSKFRLGYRMMLLALVVGSLSLVFSLMEQHSRAVANELQLSQVAARLQETSKLLREARTLRDQAKEQVTAAERNLDAIEKSTKAGAAKAK